MNIRNILLTASALAVAISPAAEKPSAEHIKLMKDLGAQNGAIRKGADPAASAKAMLVTMKAVKTYWDSKSEAAKKANASIIEGATLIAGGGEAAAGGKLIGAGCKGCHDAHRIKISDTEYEIK